MTCNFAPDEKVYLRILGTDRQLEATWLRLQNLVASPRQTDRQSEASRLSRPPHRSGRVGNRHGTEKDDSFFNSACFIWLGRSRSRNTPLCSTCPTTDPTQ